MNFLLTCVKKFTVLIWVKFESGKKTRKSFFFKRDISKKKKKKKLTRIKNYSLSGFSMFS